MTTPAREVEAAAIFLTHGLADAATTAFAAYHLDHAQEANPLIRTLLDQGIGFAAGTIVLTIGLLTAAWPYLAHRYDFPRWFAPTLVAVGAAVAVLNVGVVLA